MFKAIFFDNDGVLVDTERLYFQANREVLERYAVDLTLDLFCEYFLASSYGLTQLLKAPEEVIAEARALRNKRYSELLAESSCLVPGAEDLVTRLSEHCVVALVTSSLKHHLELIHCKGALLSKFSFVLASGDYENAKPHPDPYLSAVKRSGFKAEECLVIEDSPRGLSSARAAGVPCWVVSSDLTAACDFSAAQRIFDSLADVRTALLDGAD